ncbi:rifin [Plasmodium falciparum RAJ116]|uniref:Rifin n=1 Tax=Plasmodium falciparum RAJ116 TaxID=580058 RepID=A0A0L0CZD7_PLAFA|nr:rifin [Plasmodium falciparum RAJ116]
MKIHYINILLFELPLNILIYNQRNHKSTTHHTLKIPITRLLCECELYEPANYDNDQEMKEVMQQFEVRTSQRFHEYDESLQSKRMQCKDKCDKEIQKIILKDKLEKELMDKFATLHTDIQSDAIPTCICEKSIADKVEKGCLKCAQNLGGIVAPSTGVLGGIAELGLSVWKPAAITAAEQAAVTEAIALATQAGVDTVSLNLKFSFPHLKKSR